MTAWAEDYGRWGLFVSAFVSATLAPGGSEAVLAYLVHLGRDPAAALVGIATFGNTLGALTTWGLGHLCARRLRLMKGLTPDRLRAIERVRRWGVPLLLFSWLPLIGDGFCFAGGWLKLPFLASLAAIATGKSLRYGAVVWVLG